MRKTRETYRNIVDMNRAFLNAHLKRGLGTGAGVYGECLCHRLRTVS